MVRSFPKNNSRQDCPDLRHKIPSTKSGALSSWLACCQRPNAKLCTRPDIAYGNEMKRCTISCRDRHAARRNMAAAPLSKRGARPNAVWDRAGLPARPRGRERFAAPTSAYWVWARTCAAASIAPGPWAMSQAVKPVSTPPSSPKIICPLTYPI